MRGRGKTILMNEDPRLGEGLQARASPSGSVAADQRVVLLAAHWLPDTVFLQCDSVVEGGGRRVILHRKHLKCWIFLGFLGSAGVRSYNALHYARQRLIGHSPM